MYTNLYSEPKMEIPAKNDRKCSSTRLPFGGIKEFSSRYDGIKENSMGYFRASVLGLESTTERPVGRLLAV
jgi:hypothetical protein